MGEGRMRVEDVRQEVGEPFQWTTEEEGGEETKGEDDRRCSTRLSNKEFNPNRRTKKAKP